MSDAMERCPACGEHFTHAQDWLDHMLAAHPRYSVEVSRPAVDPPRVPTYRPILPPVQPQSLEVHVPEYLPSSVSPTGAPVIPPKLVIPVLCGGAALTVIGYEMQQGGPWDLARVGKVIVALIPAILGILSPGARK